MDSKANKLVEELRNMHAQLALQCIGVLAEILAIDAHHACGGFQIAAEHPHDGGFACTIGTYQSHDLSFAYGKIDIAQGATIVKGFTIL